MRKTRGIYRRLWDTGVEVILSAVFDSKASALLGASIVQVQKGSLLWLLPSYLCEAGMSWSPSLFKQGKQVLSSLPTAVEMNRKDSVVCMSAVPCSVKQNLSHLLGRMHRELTSSCNYFCFVWFFQSAWIQRSVTGIIALWKSNMVFNSNSIRSGEKAQHSDDSSVLPLDLSSATSTQVVWITTSWNTTSRESAALFWILETVHAQAQTHPSTNT